MKLVAALLGAGLVFGVADAVGKAGAPSPPQRVTSMDGGLIVSVPRGALRKPAKVRIRILTPAQYPPELKGATFRPGSKLYALEPARLTFLKPVALTRRIDAKVQGFDLDVALPGIVLTTRSAAGGWELLKGQTVRRAGDTLIITATTRHFSTLVAFDSAARVSFAPDSVDTVVGGTWDATIKLDVDNRVRSNPITISSVEWLAAPVVSLKENRGQQGATFACEKEGTGSYHAKVVVEESNLAVNIASLGTKEVVESLFFRGPATCRKPAPAPLQLALACVLVTHSPFGSFPSFTNWLLQFARANLPANPRAELAVSGVNNGQPVSAAIDPASGKADIKAGISSFGPKQIQKLTVNGQDATQQLVAKVGAAPTVTATQGVIAGQCPA